MIFCIFLSFSLALSIFSRCSITLICYSVSYFISLRNPYFPNYSKPNQEFKMKNAKKKIFNFLFFNSLYVLKRDRVSRVGFAENNFDDGFFFSDAAELIYLGHMSSFFVFVDSFLPWSELSLFFFVTHRLPNFDTSVGSARHVRLETTHSGSGRSDFLIHLMNSTQNSNQNVSSFQAEFSQETRTNQATMKK